ncbi:Nn.00g057450.m01.CDS01 [Neocucurbitaria sp. VM-36]
MLGSSHLSHLKAISTHTTHRITYNHRRARSVRAFNSRPPSAMAPRKPATNEKARKVKNTTTAKKSADKVVKRPARGYHKFRNGLLNVTPKGDEKELTKNNQASPLLRLPPEIRTEIWKYVLGGKEYRVVYEPNVRRFMLSQSHTEPVHAMALLRTCRQIYSEAARMPVLHSNFSFTSMYGMRCAFRQLKPYQRKHIDLIQIEVLYKGELQGAIAQEMRYSSEQLFGMLLRKLPGVKKICLLVFHDSTIDDDTVQEAERLVHTYLKPLVQAMSLDLIFEHTKMEWHSYDYLWKAIVTDNN